MSKHSISKRTGRLKAAQERHSFLMERLREEYREMSVQDLAKLSAECRQHEIHGRNEETTVLPVDLEALEDKARRMEAAAERITGGRPRRLAPPGQTGTPGTTH